MRAFFLVVLLSSFAAAVPADNTDSLSRSSGSQNSSGRNGNQGGKNGKADDPDTSLCLSPSVVQSALKNNGLKGGSAEAGQAASLTSSNNFINFCQGQTLTNGKQLKEGSCNPTPMGQIAGVKRQPSCKFLFPKNLDTIPANQDFTIKMRIRNLATGSFVNPQTSYYAAPQQVDDDGFIIGHSHLTVEAIDSLTTTTPTNPQEFAFFKGLNEPAKNGILTADVPGGLPAGTYRLASINSASNHQPVLVAVAQRGSSDDMVYFTVSDSVGKNGKQKSGGQKNGEQKNSGQKNGGQKNGDDQNGRSSHASGQGTGGQNGHASNGSSTGKQGSDSNSGNARGKGSQNAGNDKNREQGETTDRDTNDRTGDGQSRKGSQSTKNSGTGRSSGSSTGNGSAASASTGGDRVCKRSRVKAQNRRQAHM